MVHAMHNNLRFCIISRLIGIDNVTCCNEYFIAFNIFRARDIFNTQKRIQSRKQIAAYFPHDARVIHLLSQTTCRLKYKVNVPFIFLSSKLIMRFRNFTKNEIQISVEPGETQKSIKPRAYVCIIKGIQGVCQTSNPWAGYISPARGRG